MGENRKKEGKKSCESVPLNGQAQEILALFLSHSFQFSHNIFVFLYTVSWCCEECSKSVFKKKSFSL